MITNTEIQVAGLYQGMLGRLADSAGFANWVSVAESSGITAVANAFATSGEFVAYYGEPDPSNSVWSQNFVEALYYNFLAREGDEEGVQNWTDALVSGSVSVTDVTLAFLNSSEFAAKGVPAITDWYTNFEIYSTAEESPDTYLTASSLGQNPSDLSLNAGIRGVYGVSVELRDGIDTAQLAQSYTFIVATVPSGATPTLNGVAGRNPSAGGALDAELYPATIQLLDDSNVPDSVFTNIQNIQKLELLSTGGQSVVLAALAQASGVVTVDASSSTAGSLIEASAYTVGITVLAGSGDDVINTGSGNDTIVFAAGALTVGDGVDAGGGANTLVISGDASSITDEAFTHVDRVDTLVFSSETTVSATLGALAAASGITSILATAAAGGAEIDASAMGQAVTVITGAGDDVITGTALNDTIDSGDGVDEISAGLGENTVTGGEGGDTFTVTGIDTITDLGLGQDALVVSEGATAEATVVADWVATASTSNAGSVTLNSTDFNVDLDAASDAAGTNGYTVNASTSTLGLALVGSDFNDTLRDGSGSSNLTGGLGADIIDITSGGVDTIYYTPVAAAASYLLVGSDAGQFTYLDTIAGFDFASTGGDLVYLPYVSYSMVVSALTGSGVDDLSAYLSTNLSSAFQSGQTDAALVTITTGAASGVYLVANTDLAQGFAAGNTGDLVIKLINSLNVGEFSINSFAPANNIETEIQVAGLYQGMLGRLADSAGFANWVSVAESSGITAVANAFATSGEFVAYYGEPDPSNSVWSQNFVEALYYNFLAREGDEEGVQNWTDALVSGSVSVTDVTLAFLNSSEFAAKGVPAITDWYTNFEIYSTAEESPDTYLTASSLGQNPSDLSLNAGIRGVYGVSVELRDGIDTAQLAQSYTFIVATVPSGATPTLNGVAGRNPSAGGALDAELYPATIQLLDDSNVPDSVFTNIQNIQKLELLSTGGQSVVLAALAQASGVVTVDASSSTAGSLIEASAYTVGITVLAGSGDDVINTGSGNDTIVFAAGALTVGDGVDAGGGANTLVISGDASSITDEAFTHVDRVDTLVFSSETTVSATLGALAAASGITSILATAAAGGAEIDASAMGQAVTVITGAGDDVITGTNQSDWFEARLGANTLTGGLGADFFDVTGTDSITDLGQGGQDAVRLFVEGATAEATVVADWVATTSTSNAGSVTLNSTDFNVNLAAASDEFGTNGYAVNASTSTSAVELIGSYFEDTIVGGAGADQISGGTGANTITGGVAADTFNVTGTDSVTDLGAGQDVLRVSAGGVATATVAADWVATSSTSNAGSVTLNTTDLDVNLNAAGSDLGTNGFTVNALTSVSSVELIGSQFDDTIQGGTAADTLSAGLGENTVTGGEGGDTFTVTGIDTITDLGLGQDALVVSEGATAEATVVADWVATASTSNAGSVTLNSTDFNVDLDAASDAAGTNGYTVNASTSTLGLALVGSDFNDTLRDGSGSSNLTGGLGADIIDITSGGVDTIYYTPVAAAASYLLVGSDAGQFTYLDTIAGFDFASTGGDLVYLPYVSYSMVVSALTGSGVDDLSAYLSTNLSSAFQSGQTDAALVTITTGAASGVYLVANTDLAQGFAAGNTGDLVIKLINSLNVGEFSINSFAPANNIETEIQVAGLYQGMLGRLADSAGFANWVSVAESSGITAVANAFATSGEFVAYYGEPDPSNSVWSQNFVEALYYNFLAREGDEEGVQNWTDALVSGSVSVTDVTLAFLNSSEFAAKGVPAITDWYTNFEIYSTAEESPDTYLTASSLGQNPSDLSLNAGIRGVYGVSVELRDGIDTAQLAQSYTFIVATVPSGATPTLNGVAGRNPSAGGALDAELYPATIQLLDDSNVPDSVFTNIQNIQKLELLSTGGQSVVLAALAQASGVVTVDASSSTAGSLIEASAYTVGITVLAGSGDDVINTGSGNDTIVFAAGALTVGDGVDAGGGANTLVISGDASSITDEAFTHVDRVDTLVFSSETTVSATLGALAAASGITSILATAAAGGAEIDASAMGQAVTVITGAGDDVITGTALNDTIDSGDGVDEISAGLGENTVTGGEGGDTFTVTGIDTITDLGLGQDALVVSEGATAEATVVADWVATASTSNAGSVTLNSTDFNVDLDAASDAAGTNGYTVNASTSTLGLALVGSDFNDNINGGSGDDIISAGLGSNTVSGGSGDDTFNVTGIDDITDLGGSVFSVDQDALRVSIDGVATATLSADWVATASTSNAGSATLNSTNFDVNLDAASDGLGTNGYIVNASTSTESIQLIGSDFDDTILGGTAADQIGAGLGANTLTGGSAADTFNVTGTDSITDFGIGQDVLRVSLDGVSTATVSADWVATASTSNAGFATLNSTNFDVDLDSASDDLGTNGYTVNAEASTVAVVLIGSDFDDTIIGGEVADTITAGDGNDSVTGGLGIDTFNVTAGIDSISDLGQGGNDILVVSLGASANVTVATDWIASTLTVNAGSVTLYSTDYNLSLAAATGSVGYTVDASSSGSAVTLIGSSFADTIISGLGGDQITGGLGADTLILNTDANDEIVYSTYVPANDSYLQTYSVGLPLNQFTKLDNVVGFNFAQDDGDKISLAQLTYGMTASTITVSTANNLWAVLSSSLTNVFQEGQTDAVIFNVNTGVSAGSYLVVNTDLVRGFTGGLSGDLVFRLTDAVNADQFSTLSFTPTPFTNLTVVQYNDLVNQGRQPEIWTIRDTAVNIASALSSDAIVGADSVTAFGSAVTAVNAASILALVNYDSGASQFAISDSGENIEANISALVDLLGLSDLTSITATSSVVNLNAENAVTLGTPTASYTFFGTETVADTGLNIAGQASLISNLIATGTLTGIGASSPIIGLTSNQAISIGSVLDTGDTMTVSDTGFNVGNNATALSDLVTGNALTEIQVISGTANLSVANANILLINDTITTPNTVYVTDVASEISGLTVAVLDSPAIVGLNVTDAGGVINWNVAQSQSVADSELEIDGETGLTVTDTIANILTLTADQITWLGAAASDSIDGFELVASPAVASATLNVAQANALYAYSVNITSVTLFTISDTGANLSTLMPGVSNVLPGTLAYMQSQGTVGNILLDSTGGLSEVSAQYLSAPSQLSTTGTGSFVIADLSANFSNTSSGTITITMEDDGGDILSTILSSGSAGVTVNSGTFDTSDTIVLGGTDTISVVATDSTNITTGAASANISQVSGKTAMIDATAMADDVLLTTAGAGSFTITDLQGNLSNTASGANSVTLADNADGDYTITSTTAITVINGTAQDNDTVTLAGAGNKTVTGLAADLVLDATNTGTTDVTSMAGNALSITADALAGDLTVDATALNNDAILTLAGGANGKTATVNNLVGDVVATTLDSVLTVDLANNSDDNDISITTGTFTTSVQDSAAGDTVSVIATAMADDVLLTTAGAGSFTITDLQGNLSNTASGANSVTLADNADGDYTITSTTAITVINGTAQDNDTVTLAGAGNKTVTGLAADLVLDATNTGTTDVTSMAGNALSITADALAGDLTVDATALNNDAILTLAGGANGKTATVNNLVGDVVATTLDSVLTVDLANNSDDNDISITTGTFTTSVQDSAAGDTVSVIATAMADDVLLTTAGAGSFTITDLQGNLSNTASGANSVTLADNADGDYTITSTTAITVINGTAQDNDTVTLAGAGNKTVTGLAADLVLDATNTGTTDVTSMAGNALSITADALAGDLTVDATALNNDAILTLAGGANGKTATVNNLVGDVVATTLDSVLTVDLANNSDDNDISITTGTFTTSVQDSAAGDTVSVIATAMADDVLLTTAGAGSFTITDLQGNLSNTASGANSVTLADNADGDYTITSTTAITVINGTAQDNDTVTLAGAGNKTVTGLAADLVLDATNTGTTDVTSMAGNALSITADALAGDLTVDATALNNDAILTLAGGANGKTATVNNLVGDVVATTLDSVLTVDLANNSDDNDISITTGTFTTSVQDSAAGDTVSVIATAMADDVLLTTAGAGSFTITDLQGNLSNTASGANSVTLADNADGDYTITSTTAITVINGTAQDNDTVTLAGAGNKTVTGLAADLVLDATNTGTTDVTSMAGNALSITADALAGDLTVDATALNNDAILTLAGGANGKTATVNNLVGDVVATTLDSVLTVDLANNSDDNDISITTGTFTTSVQDSAAGDTVSVIATAMADDVLLTTAGAGSFTITDLQGNLSNTASGANSVTLADNADGDYTITSTTAITVINGTAQDNDTVTLAGAGNKTVTGLAADLVLDATNTGTTDVTSMAGNALSITADALAGDLTVDATALNNDAILTLAGGANGKTATVNNLVGDVVATTLDSVLTVDLANNSDDNDISITTGTFTTSVQDSAAGDTVSVIATAMADDVLLTTAGAGSFTITDLQGNLSNTASGANSVTLADNADGDYTITSTTAITVINGTAQDNDTVTLAGAGNKTVTGLAADLVLDATNTGTTDVTSMAGNALSITADALAGDLTVDATALNNDAILTLAGGANGKTATVNNLVGDVVATTLDSVLTVDLANNSDDNDISITTGTFTTSVQDSAAGDTVSVIATAMADDVLLTTAGAGSFTITDLQGNLSNTASGANSVTLADNADGDYTITSTTAITVINGTAQDNDTVTLAGAGNKTVTGLAADLVLDATNTGTTDVTSMAGNALSITADALAGDLTVDATALNNDAILTLAGGANGKTATVNNLVGDVVATTLDSVLTVDLANNSDDNDISITTGTFTTSVQDSAAGDTVSVIATAMADDVLLTTAGAGSFTITDLQGNLSNTASGANSVTLADNADGDYTITSTTAITVINGTAQDNDTVTLAGAGNKTVTGLAADLVLDATNTGTTDVTSMAGNALSITADALAGDLTVDATALNNDAILTLAGGANGKTATVNNLVGDVVATTLDSVLTVDLANNSDDNDISITTGTFTTSVQDSAAGDTVSVIATAMADDVLLTTAGAGSFTITDLQGNLSNTASGANSVTLADNADGDYTITSTTAITVINGTAQDNDTVTLAGAGNKTVTGLAADLVLDATNTGTTDVTSMAGNALSITADALAGDLTVDATALNNDAILTLAGGANGKTATVNNLVGDVVATTLDSVLTVDLANNSDDNDISITTGTFTTSVQDSAAGDTVSVIATAMADDVLLTTAGAGSFTITDLQGNLSNTASGANSVTLADNADGDYTITSTTAITVINGTAQDNDTVTLAGAGNKTVTGLAADLVLDATNTGTTDVTSMAGNALSITADALAGDLTVDATALNNDAILTLAGGANGKTATVNNLVGDVVATTLDSVLTVDLANNSDDNDISITTGTFTTSVQDSAAGDTVSVIATAMADGNLLSISGAGNFTVTGLVGDLTSTADGGTVSITSGNVATQTIDLGTGVTGTRTINATAMTNGDVLTLAGSGSLTLSSDDADVNAVTYAGAITATVTGTASALYTMGTTSSSIASSNSGGLMVNAGAMADGQVLTTSGIGNLVITNLSADLTSTSSGTVDVTMEDDAGTVSSTVSSSGSAGSTVNTGTFDADDTLTLAGTDTITVVATDSMGITTGAASANISQEAGKTATVNATAMADGNLLSIVGAGNFTVTGLVADLTSTADGGAVSITSGNVATQTIDLGTGVTGTRTINATAMTDGDVLTLAGSGSLILSSDDADVNAATYAGVITATVTTNASSTAVVNTGTGDDLVTVSGVNATGVVELSTAGGNDTVYVGSSNPATGTLYALGNGANVVDITSGNIVNAAISASGGTWSINLSGAGVTSTVSTSQLTGLNSANDVTSISVANTLNVNTTSAALFGYTLDADVTFWDIGLTGGGINSVTLGSTSQSVRFGSGNDTLSVSSYATTGTFAMGGGSNVIQMESGSDISSSTVTATSGTWVIRLADAASVTIDSDQLVSIAGSTAASGITGAGGAETVAVNTATGALTGYTLDGDVETWNIGTASTENNNVTMGAIGQKVYFGSGNDLLTASASNIVGAVVSGGAGLNTLAITGTLGSFSFDQVTGDALVSDVQTISIARTTNGAQITADSDMTAFTLTNAGGSDGSSATLVLSSASSTSVEGTEANRTVNVNANNVTDNNVLTISGASNFAVTNLSADLTSTSVTGTVAVTMQDDAGTVSSTVTISGSAGATINTGTFDTGDTLVLAGTDFVTVTVAESTNITTAAASASMTASSGVTGTVNANSMSDGNTLSISGAGGFTVTGLMADLNSSVDGGNVSITTGDVSTQTIALGSGTSGSRSINATAMNSGDVLTLTGSGSLTLSSDDADVFASTYSGTINATVTGTAASTYTLGYFSSTVSSSNSGGLTVNAESMFDGYTLSTSGSGNQTITNLLANLTNTSSALVGVTIDDDGQSFVNTTITNNAGAGTLTVNTGTFDSDDTIYLSGTRLVSVVAVDDVNISTGSASASISEVAVKTGTVDAESMSDNNLLTISGEGSFTVNNLRADLSNTANGTVVVTLDDDNQSSVNSTITNNATGGTLIVNSGIFDADDTIVLSGSRLISVVATDSINITTGTASASVSEVVGKTATVNASAISSGNTLTLSGAGNAVVESTSANVLAASLSGALTLTVVNTTAATLEIGTGTTIVTAQGNDGSVALTIDADAGGGTAGSLTFANGGSVGGDIVVTGLESGLTFNNDFAGTGDLSITTANQTQTIALGTSTSMNSVLVVATALADATVLNLTGSAAASVMLTLGDFNASTYAGNLTVTASSTGTNVITTGAGDDTITGGAGADDLTGGLGVDTFNVDAGTDLITDLGVGGQDVLVVSAGATANAAVMADWIATSVTSNAGTANLYLDVGIDIDLSLATGSVGYSIDASGNGAASVIVGSGFADTITGSLLDDTITGGAGADLINAGDGADVITDAGVGADVITHNQTTSTVAIAVTGTDGVTLTASQAGATATVAGTVAGIVNASTSTAAVTLTSTSSGNVTFTGGSNADTITGGSGADTITGGAGADDLTGGLGVDTFNVDAGTDLITDLGVGGQDVLVVSAGATANAAVMADWIATSVTSNAGTANLYLDVGIDIDLSLATGSVGYSIDASGNGAASVIVGSGFADTITGSLLDDTITGGAGADLINAGDGADVITDAGVGADVITHNQTTSTVAIAVTGTDGVTLTASQAGATATVAGTVAGIVNASTSTAAVTLTSTSSGNVTFTGGSNADTITGGSGADTITGDAGADVLTGGLGIDTFRYTSTSDTATTNTLADMDTILSVSTEDVFNLTGLNPTNVAVTADTDPDSYVLSWESGITTNYVYLKDTGNTDGYTISLSGQIFSLVQNVSGLFTAGSLALSDTTFSVTATSTGTDLDYVRAGSQSVIQSGLAATSNGGITSVNLVATSTVQVGFLQVQPSGGNSRELVEAGAFVITGTANADTIDVTTIAATPQVTGENKFYTFGFDGADIITGWSGVDVINGGAGNDALTGGTGADTFNVGADTDSITDLGDGLDVLVVTGTAVADATVVANYVAQTTNSNTSSGAVTLTGDFNMDMDAAVGSAGYSLVGGTSANTLIGSDFDDTIKGYAGADTLTGGTGADDFVYVSVSDSAAAVTGTTVTFDTITDFTAVADDINIAAINTVLTGAAAATGVNVTEAIIDGTMPAINNFSDLATFLVGQFAQSQTGGDIQAYLLNLTGNTGAFANNKYLVINNNDFDLTASDVMIAWTGTSQTPGAADFIIA